MLTSGEKYKNTPLIWDTGASFGLNPFLSYFIEYVEADIPVNDVTKVNRVTVVGTTIQKMVDVNGQACFLPCMSYHLTTTDV